MSCTLLLLSFWCMNNRKWKKSVVHDSNVLAGEKSRKLARLSIFLTVKVLQSMFSVQEHIDELKPNKHGLKDKLYNFYHTVYYTVIYIFIKFIIYIYIFKFILM